MSRDFETLERGYINGKPYYVARRREDGWTRCWVGEGRHRRTMKWLKKQKQLAIESGRVLIAVKPLQRNAEGITVNGVLYQRGGQPPYPGITINWDQP